MITHSSSLASFADVSYSLSTRNSQWQSYVAEYKYALYLFFWTFLKSDSDESEKMPLRFFVVGGVDSSPDDDEEWRSGSDIL